MIRSPRLDLVISIRIKEKVERTGDVERTKMTMTSVNSYSEKMVKVCTLSCVRNGCIQGVVSSYAFVNARVRPSDKDAWKRSIRSAMF